MCVFSVSPSVRVPSDMETIKLVSGDLEETPLALGREAVKAHWSSFPLTTPFTSFTGSYGGGTQSPHA